jgi:uncharacterized protein YvpB
MLVERATFEMYIKWFCLGSLILLIGCSPKAAEPQLTQDTIKNDIVAEMVAKTLEAYALQVIQTEEPHWGFDAPGEQYSVEITQEALPMNEAEPGNHAPEEVPDSHYIWNILGHRQYFRIGCEASAADDWAKYFGVEVNEFHFQVRLPLSDNPDLGFVGDVTGPWGQVPPYAYGVHAGPVADVLREHYDMNAVGVKGFTLQELKEQIANDKPVIAWVVGNVTWSEPYEYTDKQGNKVITAPYEHVVIVTGYNETHIRYMNNGKFYDIQTEYFERSWNVLGNMVVYLDE